jgi:hypothetical protein
VPENREPETEQASSAEHVVEAEREIALLWALADEPGCSPEARTEALRAGTKIAGDPARFRGHRAGEESENRGERSSRREPRNRKFLLPG